MSLFKKRILKYIESEGITKSEFYRNTGITRSVLDKESGLSEDNVSKFFAFYKDVNMDWLILGRGEMKKNQTVAEPITSYKLKTDIVYDEQITPLYDLEAVAGLRQLLNNGSHNILDTIKIPNLPKCDGGVPITGDSMYPLLKSGDIVLYRKVSAESIFWGQMYILSFRVDEWEEYTTVKYIQKSEKGDKYIKLVSQNQHHQPVDILRSQITALALIKASIRINAML